MRKEVGSPSPLMALGKGVFQPSRAPIAHEMKCRIKLGSSVAQQRRVDATSSRH